jgi:autotransporter family porin
VIATAVAVLGIAFALATIHHVDGSATTLSSGGWTTGATVSPTSLSRAATVSIKATVTSASSTQALVDVEVYDVNGHKVDQVFWNGQSFVAGSARTFTARWTIPLSETLGLHTVKIGIFTVGWGTLRHWNNGASAFSVVAGPSPSSTTAQPTTTARPTTTTSSTTTSTTQPTTTTSSTTSTTSTTAPPGTGHFSTLPPGSALPSDQTCASEVRPAAENRPGNASFNATAGTQKNLTGPDPTFSRVDGSFTGTTDEILQWVACKWGIDEDVVRAQAATESWWNQTTLGDWGTDPTACAPNHPIGSDPSKPGECPQSVGVLQVRYPYWTSGFPQAETSTAYNADYAYAQWRACFEGEEGWLNTVDHVGTYGPGDLWGCIGVWYSGRWHTSAAEGYISTVQGNLAKRVWTQPGF